MGNEEKVYSDVFPSGSAAVDEARRDGLDVVIDKLIHSYGVDEIVSACAKSLVEGIIEIASGKMLSKSSLSGLADRLVILRDAEKRIRQL